MQLCFLEGSILKILSKRCPPFFRRWRARVLLEFLGGAGASPRRKQKNEGKWNDANLVESWGMWFEQRTRQKKERTQQRKIVMKDKSTTEFVRFNSMFWCD